MCYRWPDSEDRRGGTGRQLYRTTGDFNQPGDGIPYLLSEVTRLPVGLRLRFTVETDLDPELPSGGSGVDPEVCEVTSPLDWEFRVLP